MQTAVKNSIIIVRRQYVDICEGHTWAAAILDLLVHWQNFKAKPGDDPGTIPVQMSIRRLQEELFHAVGIPSIRKGVEVLTRKGFVTRRNNTYSPFDRSKEFIVNRDVVIKAIEDLGYEVPGQLYGDEDPIRDYDGKPQRPHLRMVKSMTKTPTANVEQHSAVRSTLA